MKIAISGEVLEWDEIDIAEDGDIILQAKLDEHGRIAVLGRHANFGYSGYFKGYVALDGKRKNIVDWWTLFPLDEHHYQMQGEKRAAIERIRERVSREKGKAVTKVYRGFAFNPVEYERRRQERNENSGDDEQ